LTNLSLTISPFKTKFFKNHQALFKNRVLQNSSVVSLQTSSEVDDFSASEGLNYYSLFKNFFAFSFLKEF